VPTTTRGATQPPRECSRASHPNFQGCIHCCVSKDNRDFPLQLWDKLVPQVQDTLNLLQMSRTNPEISAYEALNGLMTGIGTPLHTLDVRPSYTRPRRSVDHGYPVALMHGTWAHPRTIINAICFRFPKQERTVYLGQRNSSRSTAKSRT